MFPFSRKHRFMPPQSSDDWIHAGIQDLKEAMRENNVTLGLLASTAATRADLKDLREEIIRNYVPLQLYNTAIQNLSDQNRELRRELDDLKSKRENDRTEFGRAIDDVKKMVMSAPEKVLTTAGSILAIISALVLLFQHFKLI